MRARPPTRRGRSPSGASCLEIGDDVLRRHGEVWQIAEQSGIACAPEVETLVRAVGVVAGGGTFVDRSVIERLRSARSRPESLQCLSERERGILALIAEGRTNSAICGALRLSPKTVETHVRAIFNKLDLRAAPDDHRRVLAVLRYLQAAANGEQQPQNAPPGSGESARPGTDEYAA